MNDKLKNWPLIIALALAVVIAFSWMTGPIPNSTSPVFKTETEKSASNGMDDVQQDVGRQGRQPRLTGYVPNPEGTKEFLKTLPNPEIRMAGPRLEIRAGEPVFLYKALYRAWDSLHPSGPKWRVGRQGIGDCVSWGFAHAADIHLAVMFVLGDSSEWRPAATEAIYGGSRVEARGKTQAGYSDGSYGAAAAKWLIEWGVVFREPYNLKSGLVDLTKYDSNRAKEWGNYGCGGQRDGGELDEFARKHPIRNVALVKNFDGAASAIQSGYPVAVCSNVGFTYTRDSKGFARASGSWSHCMCFIAVRFNPDGLLCLNSWGPDWITGPVYPDDQPEGSFWVDKETVNRMLSQGDSFAVSGYEGFPPRKLEHDKWVLLPTEEYYVCTPQ